MRVSRDAGTVAAAREAKQCSPLAKTAKKAGSSASRGEDAPKPERLSRVLATRLHNFPDREWFLPGGSLLHGSARRGGFALLVQGARSSRALRAGVLRRRPGAAGRRAGHAAFHGRAAGRRVVVHIVAGCRLRSRFAGLRVTQANLIPARPCFRLTINSPSVCLLSNARGRRMLGDRHSLRPLSFLMEPVSMSLGGASRGNWNTPGCHSSAQAGDRVFQRQH